MYEENFLEAPKVVYQKTRFESVTLGVQALINVRDLKLRNFDVEKFVKEKFAYQLSSMIVDELPLRKTPAYDSTYEKWTSALTYVPENDKIRMAQNYGDKIDILFMLERLVVDPNDKIANVKVREFINRVKKGEIDIV